MTISAMVGNDQRLDAGTGVEAGGDPLEHDRLADQEQKHRDQRADTPQISPSSMKGPRTNQFVAPTSFITSISRRREKIESRIVFAIRSADEMSRTIVAIANAVESTRATVTTRSETSLAVVDLLHPGRKRRRT